jgi:hypothetical protein
MSWNYESYRHSLARRGIKTGKKRARTIAYVKKGKVKIPITVQKTYKSHIYPVSPQEVKQVMERLPERQLRGLKEVSLRPPSRLPFTEQTKAFAQYVDTKNRINIYSNPVKRTKYGTKYKKAIPSLDEQHELEKYMKKHVIPHEVAHHHVLDNKRIRGGTENDHERMANYFMVKEF